MQKMELSAAKAAPAKTAAKAETVTLRDLGAALAESHGLPKNQVNAMLTGMVEAVGALLKKGKRIRQRADRIEIAMTVAEVERSLAAQNQK